MPGGGSDLPGKGSNKEKFLEGDPEKGGRSLIHSFIGLFFHSCIQLFLWSLFPERQKFSDTGPAGHSSPSSSQATVSAFQRLLDLLCPAPNPS